MFDFPVKILSSVSGVLKPPATTQLDQQQLNLKKGRTLEELLIWLIN